MLLVVAVAGTVVLTRRRASKRGMDERLVVSEDASRLDRCRRTWYLVLGAVLFGIGASACSSAATRSCC